MPQDILLITDGEIWQSKALLEMINQAHHRVFAVGVGSAVAEGFLRDLARETGGCCELVVPGEEMREKIVRHFKRIYLPRAEKVEVKWPEAPLENIPTEIGPIYDGDTLHVFGRFSTKPRGPVSLTIAMADGRNVSQSITLAEDIAADEKLLARMAIARSLTRRDPAEAAALAVHYQLISPWSNYLVVDVRDEAKKSDQLPALRKVPQMLAAGWGGSSLVSSAPSYARVSRQASTDMLYQESYSITKSCRINESILWGLDTPLVFIDKCVAVLGNNLELPLKITSYADLTACGLPEGAVKVLQAFAKSVTPEVSEETVVTVFLWALAKTQMGAGFGRNVIRLLTKAKKKQQPDPKLVALIVDAVAEVTPHTWGQSLP
jgi:Ca-activated chloride channel family protein